MKQTLLSVSIALLCASTLQTQTFAQDTAPLPNSPKVLVGPLLGSKGQQDSQSPTPLKVIPNTGTPASMEEQNSAPSRPQDRESAIMEARLSGLPAQEDTPTKLLVELKEAAANFKERYPKTQVLGFSLTPIRGLFEATVGKEVVYFDKSARFIFTGRLLDIEKGIDLTDAKLREIRRVDIAKLPLNLAIKQVKGTGERQLVLFTDVDCPFSRKLAQTLENVDNITIWTFLYPLTSIHPEAKAKSDAVWCQKDSIAALDATYKGAAVTPYTASPLCNSPVETIIRLGAELGIGGTPTLINGAGDRSAGAIPLDKLEAFISAGNQRKEQGIQK